MATSASFDRRRALLMQAALCLVLAASLAVAALVSRRQVRTHRVSLGASTTIDGLSVQRPDDWKLVREEDGLLLQEAGKAVGAPRKLKIRYVRSTVFMSPLEYLVRCGELAAHEASALMDATAGAETGVVKRIAIAGWPGILLSQTRVMSGVDARQQMMWKRTLACAVMAGGDVLLLRLEGEGAATTSDEDLVRRVAESLKVIDREPPEMGGEIELAGGIHLAVPGRILHGHETDPLRISRRLVQSDFGSWIGVDLTPCVVFPRENDQTLSAIMLLRDPQFHPGPVQKIDEHTWLCSREASMPLGGLAVLKRNKDGRALLAEFRWDRFAQPAQVIANHVTALRQSLLQQVKFEDEADQSGLLNRGLAARKTLPADPHEMFDWENPNQSWQWYDEISSRTSLLKLAYRDEQAWISAAGSTPSALQAFAFDSEYFSWRVARDWSTYDFEINRAGQSSSLSHSVRVRKSKIETEIMEGGDGIIRGTADVSGNYVPGGLLPLILGKLPLEPMILSTDSFPATAGASPGLILLRLEPAFDMPRKLPGAAEPMRCWSITPSGCGESSRWYVDEKGKLQAVAFAGRVTLIRKDDTGK